MADDIWTAFANSVEFETAPSPLKRPTDRDLDSFERTVGFALPRSYRAFVKRFGAGDLGHEFAIHAPGNPKNRRNSGLEQMVAQHRKAWTNEEIARRFEDIDRVRRLIPFCHSALDLRVIGWDPEEVTELAGPEYAIYSLDRPVKPSKSRRLADSFPDFVEGYCFGRYRHELGDIDENLFEPWRRYVRY